jgi:hypothetical protein
LATQKTDRIHPSLEPTYRYTPQQLKFFASGNEQDEEHSLEDSICRPLIGRQDNEPFLYFLKDDPDVVNIHLESIEHHIRYKDPERHKAKLLERIHGEQTNKDGNKNGHDIAIIT